LLNIIDGCVRHFFGFWFPIDAISETSSHVCHFFDDFSFLINFPYYINFTLRLKTQVEVAWEESTNESKISEKT